jgi:serine protease Do
MYDNKDDLNNQSQDNFNSNNNDWSSQSQDKFNTDNNDWSSQSQDTLNSDNNDWSSQSQDKFNTDNNDWSSQSQDTLNSDNSDWSSRSQNTLNFDNSDLGSQSQDTSNFDNSDSSSQPQDNFNPDNNDWSSQSQGNFNPDSSDWSNQSQGFEPVNEDQAQTYYKEIIVKPKKKHKALSYISLMLVTSLITSCVVGGAMYAGFSKKISDIEQSISQTSSNSKVASTSSDTSSVKGTNLVSSSDSGDLTVTEIAKKVGPSIVGIKMQVKNSRPSGFFGSNSSTSDSEGSGIIISSDGYIMTNYHVVQYADTSNSSNRATLTVYLSDKREAQATFIGGDSENDLALIKINLTGLTAAELGDSSTVEVGDLAVAIGNPLGLEFAGSVTSGVISALNRQLDTGDVTMNVIQTDAAINPGNSGGALLDSKGQVIGINSAKISITGVEGLGFAIPINTAKPIIEQLKAYGYVKGKPLVGISAQEVSEEVSSMYGIPVGVYIVEVTQGGAAANAGIVKGDVLIKLDGKTIKTMSDVDSVKKSHKAGDTVDAVVSRNGKNVTVKLTFTEDK